MTLSEEAIEISRALAEEIIPKLETVAAMLPLYVAARDQESGAKKDKDHLGALIKQYLEHHEGVVWAEAPGGGFEARLKERRLPGKDYDVLSCWQNDRLLFERLVLTGCVKFDATAIKAAGANVGGADRYAYPERIGQYLEVQQIPRLVVKEGKSNETV